MTEKITTRERGNGHSWKKLVHIPKGVMRECGTETTAENTAEKK